MFEGVERGAEARLAAYLESAYLGSAYQAQELATQGFLYRNFAGVRPLGLRELHSRAALLRELLRHPLSREIVRVVRDPRLRKILGRPPHSSSLQLAPALFRMLRRSDRSAGPVPEPLEPIAD